jgi:hypothetical protein
MGYLQNLFEWMLRKVRYFLTARLTSMAAARKLLCLYLMGQILIQAGLNTCRKKSADYQSALLSSMMPLTSTAVSC